MFKKILMLFILIIPVSLHAEESTLSKWSGDAELGYLKSTGNTENKSMHAKGSLINERIKWKHTTTFEVTNKSDKGETIAKRWYVTAKSDYKISNASYMFVGLSHESDDFSGYDYQSTGTFGYGNHIINKKILKLDLEAGVGTRQSKLNSGASLSETILKGAAKLIWVISNTSEFNQNLSVESGNENTQTRSVTALKMQIVGNLSSKITYSIKYNSDVPVGIVKKDTETVISLLYNF
ncbi:MAG: YdiY family protein [Thiohalomonadales bacterium]